ncbi:MAG: GAF domain-containing sensor histidine kinase [Polyangiaceae bacterium]|nr:GAF domain-containing sensor histidine kinase [Polyangiaceae bacterium]
MAAIADRPTATANGPLVGTDGPVRAAPVDDIQRQRAFVDQLSRDPATLSGNVETIAHLVTESCARLLGVERVSVWFFNESETELHCIDEYHLSTDGHSCGTMLRQDALEPEFRALKSSLYVDANDPLTDPRTSGYVETYVKPNHITSMLDVVIRFGGRNLGALCFEHVDTPHEWQQHEIDFGCMVGSQLSLLLERRELRRTEDARRQIQQQLEDAQELDALKSHFLANVSHELRTPLTLLLGPVEDLIANEQNPPTEWQKEHLATIHHGALRLLKHVNALLDFVRAEAGRLQAHFEPTDLVALTTQLVGFFESTATNAGVDLRLEVEPIAERAYVDREMWEKIVLNLISNALKFTHQGEIVTSLRVEDDRFVLTVRDTGIGIPPEAIPHIFERFYRVPGAQGRTAEGAGIGLALALELVRLHKGTISVESYPGSGSTFRVEIPRGHAHLPRERVHHLSRELTPRQRPPLIEEAHAWIAPRPTTTEAVTNGKAAATRAGAEERPRILVADDNGEMRAYLARLLSAKYDVETVADGFEALRAARTRAPALVLSDVMMPRLDGIGLLRGLRASPSTSTVPVVLVSARAGEEAAVEALAIGADDYVSKPFSARELLARVATHIELARMRRQATESALKDVFLGIAAHELRTPLTSLKLRIQLARRELQQTRDLRGAMQRLDGADRSIARLDGLALELLSVSAIQSGKLALTKERVDLAAICRDAANEESDVSGRTLSLELPEGPVEALVDRERITEVVKHLLSNAFKYSPGDSPVRLVLQDLGAEAAIQVHDHGPGIPREELPHLFGRFYRVPGIEVQTGSRVGLGLGLYISKAIVEQHGGRIEVTSTRARGSSFVVTLPRGG